jgi:GNAT superfamily N-acetyltransferase
LINDEIAELCRLMHKETIFGKLTYNPEKLLQFVKMLSEDENAIVIAVGSPVVGLFCGEVYPHIYTDDLVAVDQLMYVHPEHRRDGIASGMVDRYKKWAESKGAKMTLIGSSTGFEGADTFFSHKGFTRLGGNYGLW